VAEQVDHTVVVVQATAYILVPVVPVAVVVEARLLPVEALLVVLVEQILAEVVVLDPLHRVAQVGQGW
jgi:hypothetical protein